MKPYKKENEQQMSQSPILKEDKDNNPLFKATIFLENIYKQCRIDIDTKGQRKLITDPSTKSNNIQRSDQKHPQLNINNEFNYIFYEGDEIINQKKNIIYRVNDLLGKGTFGQVLSCVSSTGYKMAIKVIKNQPAYKNQGLVEFQKIIGGSKNNYLNVFDAFIWNNHVCTAMQIMDNSLFDIQAKYQGLQMKWILIWTKKLLFSLVKMHKLGIIHNDIKPQNIMFRSQKPNDPLFIDFSSSCYADKQYFTYIQSRFYRAPQVIMKMFPYSPKIDIWSLGCLLAQIYLGLPLFPGSSSYDQLKKILKLSLGEPTIQMVQRSQEGKRYFTISYEKQNPIINLKTDDNYYYQDKNQFILENDSYFQFESLKDFLKHINPQEQQLQTHKSLLDLIQKMLVFDPDERISAEQAYLHPFTQGKIQDLQQIKNKEVIEKKQIKAYKQNY